MTENDQANCCRRSAHHSFEVSGGEIFVAISLNSGKKRRRAVGGNQTPDGGMPGGRCFAAEGVKLLVRQSIGRSIQICGDKQEKVAIVGNALMVAIHGLKAVAQCVSSGLNGLVA